MEKAYVVKDSKTGKTRGFGFVIYEREEDFEKAFLHEPHIILEKQIHLRKTQTRKEMSTLKVASNALDVDKSDQQDEVQKV